MYKLTPKQVVGINWLLKEKYTLLGDAVGTGKTATLLHAAFLMQPKRVLVLSSEESLNMTWVDEFKKWFPEIWDQGKVRLIAHHNRKGVLANLYRDRNEWVFCLAPRDYARTYESELSQWPWDIIIVDEAHHFGGYESGRTNGLFNIQKATKPKALWMASANFIRKRSGDAYTFLRLIKPKEFPHQGFTSWAKEYIGEELVVTPCHTIRRIRKMPQDPNKFQEMFAQHMLARPRDDGDYIKANRPSMRVVDMKGQQLLSYNRMRDEWWAELDEERERGAQNPLVRDLFLRQICVSHQLLDPESVLCAGAKIDDVLDIIDSTTEQVFLCSNFAQAIHRLSKKHKWEYFTGQEGDATQAISRWKAGDAQVLAATYGVGGESLNLQNGSVFIGLDYDWKAETYYQAVGRLARKGQTRPVLPYMMMARNSIDDYVLRTNQFKEEVIEASIPPEEISLRYFQERNT